MGDKFDLVARAWDQSPLEKAGPEHPRTRLLVWDEQAGEARKSAHKAPSTPERAS